MKTFLLTTVMSCCALVAGADILPGHSYRIVPVGDSGKSLFVENSSPDNNTGVVVWTDTNVPAQQWTALQNDDGTFSFVNVYTGLSLGRSGQLSSETARLVQSSATSTVSVRWVLTQTGATDTYTLGQTSGSVTYYATAEATTDGGAVSMDGAAEGNLAETQKWTFVEVQPKTVFDDAARRRMMKAFADKYIIKRGNWASFGNTTGWGYAEILETMIDAYETTGDAAYLDYCTSTFGFFNSCMNGDWLKLRYDDTFKWYGHDYNDDVMWMIIASARLYHLTGNTSYRDLAKKNFDGIYARGFMSGFGTMRWRQGDSEQAAKDNLYGTTSCINCPTVVAACYIAAATGDDSYYEKARALYSVQRRYLFNAQTGEVYDSFSWNPETGQPRPGGNKWVSTYNQGTMLGAALMLYRRYGDAQYRQDAERIVACSRRQLCDQNGIIKVCQTVDGDLCGFKGILMRYVRKYITDLGHTEEAEWLRKNAFRAYNNMNSEGITSSAWLTKSSEDWTYGDKNYEQQVFGNSTAISVAFNAPLADDNIIKQGDGQLTPDMADYRRGVEVTEEDGRSVVADIKNNYYISFSNVDFGSDAATAITVEAKTVKAGTTVSFLDGGPDGQEIATLAVPSTSGAWQTLSVDIPPMTARHDLCLKFAVKGAPSAQTRIGNVGLVTVAGGQPYDITQNGGQVSSQGFVNAEAVVDGSLLTVAEADGGKTSVTYRSPWPARLTDYTLAPEVKGDTKARPASWTLLGSTDGEKWTAIDSRDNFVGWTEGANSFKITAQQSAYTRFRLDVTANGGSAVTRLAGIRLMGTCLAQDDITADGGARSSFAAAFDKDAATMLEGVKEITYNAKGYYSLRLYSVSLCEKAGTTLSWTLLGSMAGQWKELDRRKVTIKSDEANTLFFCLSEPSDACSAYRLLIDGEGTDVTEWQLFGAIATNQTLYNEVTKNGGQLSSSTGEDASALRPLVDGSADTSVSLPFSGGETWIGYESDYPVMLSGYGLTSGYDEAESPKAWNLMASDDGQTWTTLSSQTSARFNMKGKTLTYKVSSARAFRHFRLVVSRLYGDDATSLRLGELQLYGQCLGDGEDMSLSDAEMPGAADNEGADKLFDGTADTKYCFDYYGSAWTDCVTDVAVAANLYSITAANDDAARDPKAWQLLGSDDGETWTLLDSRSGQSFYDRKTTNFYSFENNRPFARYRLQLTENNGGPLAQMSEWQLFRSERIAASVSAVTDGSQIALWYDRAASSVVVDTADGATVRVYSPDGLLVTRAQVGAGRRRMSLSSAGCGLYVVKAVAADGSQTVRKIVVD